MGIPAIFTLDETILKPESIRALLKNGPEAEELESIHAALELPPEDLPLDKPEKFLLALGEVKNLNQRLQVWGFKVSFKESMENIVPPLAALKAGCKVSVSSACAC